jgi:uncharacterized protein
VNPVAVSNTGPLIALAHAEVLHILSGLFEKVLVPEAVRDEIEAGSLSKLRFADLSASAANLQVLPNPPVDPLLAKMLDQGEAAVVLLAQREGGLPVLLDERKGRKIAGDIFGLPVIGTAGLLIKAKRAGLIPHVGTALDRMIAAGYYIHDRIRNQAIELAGE